MVDGKKPGVDCRDEGKHSDEGSQLDRARYINLDELESFHEVVDVVSERFQRRVRPLRPHFGLLADQQVVGQGLQVG